MALLEKHRNTVYNAFVPLLGEEVTEAVLAHFPARDVEEMVTKEHLDRRFAEQNAGIDRRFAEFEIRFDRKLDEVRTESDRKVDESRAEFNAKLDDFRADVDRRFDELRAENIELRLDVARQVNDLRVDVAQQIAAQGDKTFHRMLTLAGIGLGVITMLFAAFT